MKKLLFCFTMLAATITGCSYDYRFAVSYNIINDTDAKIVLVKGTSETIMPGEEVTIHEGGGMCSKNYEPTQDYPEDHLLLNNVELKLKVNGQTVSREIWMVKYWDFASEIYHATYTLTVTDELIKSIGFE